MEPQPCHLPRLLLKLYDVVSIRLPSTFGSAVAAITLSAAACEISSVRKENNLELKDNISQSG